MIIGLIVVAKLFCARSAEHPNKEVKTSGGKVFWEDIKATGKYRLQVHMLDGHARILDENNVRKASGIRSLMEEKFERLTRDTFLKKGDIIGVARSWYDHYGIYVGDGEVIHYAATQKHISKDAIIHKVSLEEFLEGEKDYFVLHFPPKGGFPRKLHATTNFKENKRERAGILESIFLNRYTIFSSEETVKRAYSRLGEQRYSLCKNNCEHFAIWCKTGEASSRQVDSVLSF